MIKVELKAKHFLGASDFSYINNQNCPFAQALQDHFQTENCSETIDYCVVDGKWYTHIEYSYVDFLEDHQAATELKFDDTTLRTIELKPL